MKLHYAPGTIAAASVIALQEAGTPHTLVKVDFAQAEQTKPQYLALNPKGRVPALETECGILTETIAILEYVAPSLVPADPWQAAKMREVMTYLATTAHVNHAHKMRGHRWANDAGSHSDMTAKVPETMAASAQWLESAIAGPYTLDAGFSLADPYLFAVCKWLPGDGVDLSGFPKLSAFMAAMSARPAVQALQEKGIL